MANLAIKCHECGRERVGESHECPKPVRGHCHHYPDLTPEQCGECAIQRERDELRARIERAVGLLQEARHRPDAGSLCEECRALAALTEEPEP